MFNLSIRRRFFFVLSLILYILLNTKKIAYTRPQ